MNFRISLVIFCCHFMQGFVTAKIDSSQQCSNSSSSAECLNVLWAEFKPYSYLKDSSFGGIIPGLLKIHFDDYCEGCWKLNLTGKVSRQEVTTGKIPSYIDIVLPYSANTEKPKVPKGMNFIDFVDNPSVVYITKKASASAIPRKLVGAIWNAWPVLIFALLLSLLSGVLLWFLEMWHNPDEFPRSFLKGSWEGFWWAFVSMTTVGYGDRSPRSILGQGFAIIWIMIGICICSVFTATLTTSLTTITLEEKKTLARAKVGAIRNSLEAYAGVSNKAKVVSYTSTNHLWYALEDDAVEGILLDSYFSAAPEISYHIEDNDYKISQTVQVKEMSYGILIRAGTNLSNWLEEELLEITQDTISKLIADEIGSESQENEAEARSDSVFNPTGDIFYPTLYVCVAFTVVMLIAGLSWEFCLKNKCYKRAKAGSSAAMNTNAANLEQMEKEMIADIQKMFSFWRARRDLEIGIAGPMEVEDVEQRGDVLSLKRNGSQLGMKQQPTQQDRAISPTLQQQL